MGVPWSHECPAGAAGCPCWSCPQSPWSLEGVCPPPCPHPQLPRDTAIPVPGAPQVPEVQDRVQESLRRVQRGEAESLPERDRAELKRRKLLLEV